MIGETLEDPIFILAYMHSGTTLLQQILGRNPAIYVSGGETRHFSNLSVTRQKYPDLSNDDILRDYLVYLIRVICNGYATVNFRETANDPLAEMAKLGLQKNDIDGLVQIGRQNRDYNQLYVLAFDFLTDKAGKICWLDKLPGYVSQFEQIRDSVPRGRFIELVRDGRDILASKKKRTATGGGYDPLWDSMAWQSAMRAGDSARTKYPNQIIRVKYEDLVSSPEIELSRICNFLNLDFDGNMLSVGWINSTSADNSTEEQGISTSAVGKWENQLTPGDIALSQMIAGKELERAGYQISTVSWQSYILLPILLGKSGIEFFTRLINRWREGGFHFFLNVLSNYRGRLQ